MGELKDKIKGNVNEALGKAKQQSDDPDTRDEGAGQELKGKFQQVKGEVEGAFDDKI
ncbi:MAG TPA: CsbD family protein [Allosphingosinicella sp.]